MTPLNDFTEVPVIDLGRMGTSGPERQMLASEVVSICHRIGFFVVTNHGVADRIPSRVFETMDHFFSLSTESKRLIDKLDSAQFRGWEEVGSEQTNNRVDVREQIDLWSEWPALPARRVPADQPWLHLLGPNQWPPDHVAAGLKEAVTDWFDAMGELADRLLSLLAEGLHLASDHFMRLFGDQPMSLTKLISYPRTPAGGAGVNPHHDTGFLTVLAPGPTPGLHVQNHAGEWLAVPPVEGGLVINLGEMLQAMTGNYLVATPHRVITEAPRLSAAYFHGPSLDTRLDPLPLEPSFADAVAASEWHSNAGFMAGRQETSEGVAAMAANATATTYGQQLWNYFSRSYPANMARHYG